jgi:uncharacterized protein YegP (UPF0339 family)
MKADKAESKAEMEARIKADNHEMMAKMETSQERTDAKLEEM